MDFAGKREGENMEGYEKWITGSLLGIMAIFDWKEKKIPLGILILFLVCGVLEMVIDFIGNHKEPWSLLGGLVVGIVLLLLSLGTKKLGIADAVVMLILGGLREFRYATVLLCVASTVAALVALVLILGKKLKPENTIPFLPFLGIAYLLVP